MLRTNGRTKVRSHLLAAFFFSYLGINNCWSPSLYTCICICNIQIQLTLVISKSKGPSKTLRDIRTSTYQICSIEEKKTIRSTKFHKWLCNLTPLVRKIYWRYCGKGEELLPRSNSSSFPQYFATWFEVSVLKQGPGFLFEISGYSR